MLANILHNFVEPFINPTFSLAHQVHYISICSHLLFCQYHLNRTAFLPNPLYYDLQTAMKNIIFSIAKQLWLDSSMNFSLLDVGTDPIEVLFGMVCMCGGHNSAVNYKQGIDCLWSACDINGVYSRNPDLHCGHQRLNLTRLEHLDHINRDMWKGNTVVRNVNLQSAWFEGCSRAISILSSSPIWTEDYDFNKIFSVEGVDLLCTFGGRKYPGINHDDDGHRVDEDQPIASSLSMPELEPPSQTGLSPTSGVAEEPQMDNLDPRSEFIAEDDNELALSFEDQLEHNLTYGPSDSNSDQLEHTPSLMLVSDSGSSLPPVPPSGQGVRPHDYLFCKGKWVHKASVCHLLLNHDFSPKLQDQLLRIHGFTSVYKPVGSTTSTSTSGDSLSFVVSNPFVTLIRINDHTTSLALVRSTSIHESGISRNDINVKTLQENRSKVKISGNILLLVPSQSSDLPDLESAPSSVTWVWNGGYLKIASAVPGVDVITQKVVEISTLGSLIELVNPSIVEASSHLSVNKSTEVNTSGLTWSLKQDPLDAAIDVIWNRLSGMKMPVSNITLICANVSEHFPYHLDNGKLKLLWSVRYIDLLFFRYTWSGL
jgi:hypothetical protein